ncbi:hypothetical protein BJV82DRAFT_622452 [Fennellomyces sp. T-0311]|nr:hypothetical protein BJV82DRAFT_622452 [Fennellomyces sp. T-0311]
MLYDSSLSFATAYRTFREKTMNHSPFTAGCNAFLVYDDTKECTGRLLILYILYALYADTPLEKNPFLTFFLEFVSDDNQRGGTLEQQFVYCILEGSIVKINEQTPRQISENTLQPLPRPSRQRVNELERSVALLIGDPLTPESTTDHALTQHAKKLDPDMLNKITRLMHDACIRTLTIPEQQTVRSAFQLHADAVVKGCGLSPERLRDLVETNHILAMDVAPLFLDHVQSTEYLAALAKVPVGHSSVELIFLLLSTGRPVGHDFLHAYISNGIRTCELYEDGPQKDKHVRLFAKFIQTLLEKRMIPVSEYLIEIQSFCVGYFRFKGVATLFQLASSEAQRMGFQVDRQVAI